MRSEIFIQLGTAISLKKIRLCKLTYHNRDILQESRTRIKLTYLISHKSNKMPFFRGEKDQLCQIKVVVTTRKRISLKDVSQLKGTTRTDLTLNHTVRLFQQHQEETLYFDELN